MPVIHVFCVVGVSAGKGMKPFPALGALLAKAPQGYACLSALSGLARKNIPREMRLSQRRGERQGSAEGMHALAPFAAWREKISREKKSLAKARRTQRNVRSMYEQVRCKEIKLTCMPPCLHRWWCQCREVASCPTTNNVPPIFQSDGHISNRR